MATAGEDLSRSCDPVPPFPLHFTARARHFGRGGMPRPPGRRRAESIVGYQTMNLKAGFNMITPTFTDAGTSDGTYDIQKVKISDEAGSYGFGSEQIQVLGTDGNVSATYTWFSKDISGADEDAWCDDSMTPVTYPITRGEAFLLYTEAEGLATVSGAVSVGVEQSEAAALLSGFNGIGNASPIETNIQKIKISDEGGSYGFGSEQIQIVGTDGNVNATYTWFSKDISGAEEDAWCDDSLTPVTKTFKPGEGFLLYTEAEGTVELPTAL